DDTTKHLPPRIVQVARLTEIKHQHILLESIQDIDCKVIFVGDIPDGYDDSYKRELQAKVKALGLEGKVIFAGAQTPQQVLEWYHSATIAVNLSPQGLFDKGALEGMACAIPTIVSNPAFGSITGEYQSLLHIPTPDDTNSLNTALKKILTLSLEERQQIGNHLRDGI